MPHYLLSMHYDDTDTPSEEDLAVVMEDLDAFNEDLRAAGAWVFTAGLHPAATATVVAMADGGVVTTDGPFLETKEHLGGFWVIEVEDLDAALVWAGRAAAALRDLPVEVRPVAGGCG